MKNANAQGIGKHTKFIEMIDEHSGISEDTYKKVMSLMGRLGGLARAKKLTEAQRQAIGKKGGEARGRQIKAEKLARQKKVKP